MRLFGNKKTAEAARELKVPRCIAVIMDGNGRWAKKRALPRTAGHSAGANNFKTICRYANSIGVKYMVFYAFSTENWKRPAEEVGAIMRLFENYLEDVASMVKENMRLVFIGDRDGVTDRIRSLMENAEKSTEHATGMTVALAINYGGRDEIVKAARSAAERVKNGEISIDDIDEDYLSGCMYNPDIPDPDLVIRPSGEYRLSNFLIWQSAYSEFWFSDILWPDFKPEDLDEAIRAYSGRDRRFGGIK